MILPLPSGFERHILRLRRGTVEAIRYPAVVPDTAETVVMLPGYIAAKEDFRLVMPLMAAAGYDCWAYDYLDQFSATGLDSYNDYTLESLAADLAEIVGDRSVHYLGHCMGGLVARRAVLDRPSHARSLTLVSSGPHLRGARYQIMWLRLARNLEAGRAIDMWPVIQRLLPKNNTVFADFWRHRLETINHAYVRGIAESLRAAPDLSEELAASGVPVMVLYGSRDRRPWNQEMYHDMAVRLGAAEAVLPDVAHIPLTEQPEAMTMTLLGMLGTVREARR